MEKTNGENSDQRHTVLPEFIVCIKIFNSFKEIVKDSSPFLSLQFSSPLSHGGVTALRGQLWPE